MTSTQILGGIAGLATATAVLLIIRVVVSPARIARSPRMAPWLAAAGLPRLTPAAFVALCVGAGITSGVLSAAATGLPMVALIAAVVGSAAPVLVARRRVRLARQRTRESWPEAVDSLVSAVRAGLSLPEAVVSLATAGPAPLRPLFSAASREYRATGSFHASLDTLRDRAADPAADRVVAALQLAHEWGGTEVGEVLRTLSSMMREDARLRSEIRGRQSWTVSAARMAVAAPWLTLLLLSTRSETVAAYATPAGGLLLVGAAAASAVAYLAMTRIAVLPDLPRLTS